MSHSICTWRHAAFVAAIALGACGEESTGPRPVASVDVTPASATLAAGQTVALSGTPRDSEGRALTDREITWTSGNTSLATVIAGSVTGVAEGSTEITATAEGVSGSATVMVVSAVASIQVLPAQVSLLPGETVQLNATAQDAQGAPIMGRTFTWISNDESVATVDSNGLVSSVSPGSATVYATTAGRSGGSTVGVDDPNAPRVLSTTPAELAEGQPATLNGANFSPVAAENVVTIDGVRATVTGATATSLDIVVPALACRPRHLADIAVTVGPRTGRSSYPVRPAAAFQLAAGELVLLRDPPAYCLQFAASAADEEYLIGIQSNAAVPSTVSLAQITAEKDATAPAATASVRGIAQPTVGPQATFPDEMGARMQAWREREAVVMEREVERARQLQGAPPAAGPAMIEPPIPGNVTVGTPATLRYPNLDGNTCSDFVVVQGTVRAVTASGIWVSDDANPAGGYTDLDYTQLAQEFEADVFPTVTGYFGSPADGDANGRVVVVVTKEVNDDGIGGIVPSANLFPRVQCAASNEGEYFFMFTPDPLGQYDNGVITVAQARSVAPAIAGHELVHNVHLSRRLAAGHTFWDSWMHEGQATLGEEIMGHALTPPRGPGQNYGWTVIRNLPPDNLASRPWYYDAFRHLFRYYGWSGDGDPTNPNDEGSDKRANAPEGCTFLDSPSGTNAGLCADRGLLVYGVSWSFLRWITDHYASGYASEAAMHQAWINGAPTGFASIEALTGEEIEVLLANWAASLYLDDRVQGLDPLLTMPSWNLADVDANVAPEARLQPRVRSFTDFTQGVQVRAGSTAYFLVSGANRPSTAIRVRSPSGAFLSPTVQLWVARVR